MLRGTLQGHPWLAQLRHPCLEKPSEHQQTDQIASSFPHLLGEKSKAKKKKQQYQKPSKKSY